MRIQDGEVSDVPIEKVYENEERSDQSLGFRRLLEKFRNRVRPCLESTAEVVLIPVVVDRHGHRDQSESGMPCARPLGTIAVQPHTPRFFWYMLIE